MKRRKSFSRNGLRGLRVMQWWNEYAPRKKGQFSEGAKQFLAEAAADEAAGRGGENLGAAGRVPFGSAPQIPVKSGNKKS